MDKHQAISRSHLENLLLPAQISESPDIRDDKRDPKLIVGAHLPQRNAPIFDSQPATIPVVTDLYQLILQRIVGDVVAYAAGDVEALASLTAVADQSANLIGLGLQHQWIGVQPEIRDGKEKSLVRLDFCQCSDGGELPIGAALRVVFQ